MADYITVDGGTTNTRLHLVRQGQVVDTLKFPVGARSGISDKTVLETTVRDGIRALLEKHALTPAAITRILASGMITSEFGLCQLPHLPAPAGLTELHAGIHETLLPDISPIPFAFIRGVRTDGDLEHFDMMRGEETELMGMACGGEGVYILPGSHSKVIRTDCAGRICDFRTMLTGEMIAALSSHTILKDAVVLSGRCISGDHLKQGFSYALQHGISEGLFKVRILKNAFGETPDAVYSFYLGVVLSPELQYVLSLDAPHITVGGKRALREPMTLLLKANSAARITAAEDATVETACALGAVKIWEFKENKP